MKRFLALFFVLSLLLSLVPTVAFAAEGRLEISVPSGVSITLRKGFAGSGSTVSADSTTTADGYKTYIYEDLSTGTYSFTTSGSGYNALTKDIYYVSGTVETIVKDPGKKAGNGWEQGSGNERNDEIIGDDGLFATTTTAWPGYEFVFQTPTFTDETIAAQQFTPHSTMLSFLKGLLEICPNMYYYKIGSSPKYGYEMPLVVFTKTDLTGLSMEEAGALVQQNGKPTVFHQAQVHGNEPAPGEGSLALAYAVATGNLTDYEGGDILDSVNILIVPRINADGAKNFQRNNVYDGLNMNRGYLSVRSSEIRDTIAVYNAFRPQVVMDAHEWTPDNTSEVSYFDDLWLFTSGSANNSSVQLETGIEMMENVFTDVEKQGIRPYFYSQNMTYTASEGVLNSLAPYYYGLRGSYAFCIETRGIGIGRGCFERRVMSQYLTAESFIRYTAKYADEVMEKCATERARIAAAGATFGSDDPLVLQHKNSTYSKSYARPTLDLKTNTVTNPNNKATPSICYLASKTRARPTAYVLKAGTSGLSDVLKVLNYHNIPYVKLEDSLTLSVKQYSGRASSASLSSEKSVVFEAGSYLLPMNHIDGNILAMLMEPDVGDTSASASYSTFVQRSLLNASSIYRYEGNIVALLESLNVPTHTINFYGAGNELLDTQTVKEGESVTYAGPTPTKAYTDETHYVFEYWAYSNGDPASMGPITLSRDFYAVFSEEVHSYTPSVTTEPSCGAEGITTYLCSCGKSYTESIPSLNHSAELQGVLAPTCTALGYTGDMVCITCGTTLEEGNIIPMIPHTEELLPAVEPTCTATGYTGDTICTICGTTLEEGSIIPMVPHTEEIIPGVEPGCLSSGLTEGKKCSVCDTLLVAQEVLQRLGHDRACTDNGDGTHTDACTRCGKDYGTSAHTTENGICTLCGAGEAVEPTPDPAVEIRHTLNLASDISINYAIAASQLADYDSYYLECVLPVYDESILVGENTIRIEPELRGNYYYFTLTGITAVQMGNEIKATLHMEKDGAPYLSNTDLYSVATYAYSQLRKDGAAKTLKTLCADLLIYGSAAQTFKGYRTDALVDSTMTEADRAYCSDTEAVVFGNNNSILDDVDVPDVTWVGKSLSLESKVVLKFIFDTASYAGNPEELTLRITYTTHAGEVQTVTLSDPTPYGNVSTRYAFDFDGLLAAELRSVVNVAVFAGETQVSSTLRYSADTYGNNKTGTLLTLCKALFAYSDSAKAFFG